MDKIKFDNLISKLQTASWTLYNAISNTKIFTTIINKQKIRLINVENGPIYINGQRLNLSDQQILTMIEFINNLINEFSSAIQSVENENNQEIVIALDRILD